MSEKQVIADKENISKGELSLNKICKDSGLAKREIQLIKEFLKDKTIHQVAELFNLSLYTTQFYLKQMQSKLSCAPFMEYLKKIGKIDNPYFANQ